MFSDSPQTGALQLMCFLFAIYTLAGGALLLVLKGEDTLFKKLIALPFLPTFVIWGLVLVCLSIPYSWLYPERHLTELDFEGTEEEKKKLRDYRSECGKIGFLRRLGEKVGLAEAKRPVAPFPLK